MILSFELTMPNVGSWNGQWTGQSSKYYRHRTVSKQEAELKQSKAEAWDEGYNEAEHYVGGLVINRSGAQPTNPYKEEREPPTWEHRDAWSDGFADNH